jgi:ankyrin repeat protein
MKKITLYASLLLLLPATHSLHAMNLWDAAVSVLRNWWTPITIWHAAQQGDGKRISELILQGIDINQADRQGTTLLHWAAINGITKAIQPLIDHGADINKADKQGCTPLYTAAEHGNTEVVRLLLNNGTDINKADKQGRTSLAVATPEARKIIKDFIQKQKQAIITLLLGHHARCGANSQLTQLPPPVLQDIAQLAYAIALGK